MNEKKAISHLLMDPIIEAVMFCSKLLIRGMCFDKNDLGNIFSLIENILLSVRSEISSVGDSHDV